MDFLGFSSEDLEKLNCSKNAAKPKTDAPKVGPMPDLSKYREPVRAKYLTLREAEQTRLCIRHQNQFPPNPNCEKAQSSNLAKIQKFTKKLKTLSDDNREEALKELNELSLAKFITEAAHSVSENKFQQKDFLVLIEVCSNLHQRYPDFQKELITQLKKQHKEGDIVRKRFILRFVAEMICYGLWNDISGFLKVTRDYCNPNSPDLTNNLILISSIFRSRSEELFGFPTSAEQSLRQSNDSVPLPKAKVLNDNEINTLVKTLRDFYKHGLKFIEEVHLRCKRIEERNKRIKEELCMIEECKVQESTQLRSELSKAREAVLVLSDILNEPPPVFEEEKQEQVEEPKNFNPFEVFEKDEDREFYLKIPSIEESKESSKSDKDRFDLFKKRLMQISTKESADSLAEEFMKIGTKQNIKLLIDSLCNYQKNVQALPFYARLVAYLGASYKKLPNKITKTLESEFNTLQEQSDPSTLDIRLRNLRFLSEFLKFQLYSPNNILNCFELCLCHFSGETIQVACCFLHCCGRYLFRHPQSSERTNLMINRMLRLKEKKNFPPETEHLIEEAVFTCRPKEKLKKKKVGPVLYEFIKFKMLSLSFGNTQETIKTLVNCPMPECEMFLVKSIFKSVRKGNISNLQNVSKVLAGIKLNQSFVGVVVMVVDYLCEDVLSDLKINDFRKAQHRILMIKFYGELHCYNIIDHTMVFKMLYTLLNSSDTFKVKLIWTLLDSVKQVISSHSYKTVLESFLTDFKRYVASKPGISIEMEFLIMDLLETFRSNKSLLEGPSPGRQKLEASPKEEVKSERLNSSSSDGEAGFDEEFNKMIEMGNISAKNAENIKERETPIFFRGNLDSNFKVLIKKGGKVQPKDVNLPESHPLVAYSLERRKQEAAEREKLSKVVVDLNQRMMNENK